MGRFSTVERLSAWSGVAPGNDESVDKQRSGKTRKGNRTLRAGLTQLDHAAARTKGTYLSALYHRLATRRGRKRADPGGGACDRGQRVPCALQERTISRAGSQLR
jgi:transposase